MLHRFSFAVLSVACLIASAAGTLAAQAYIIVDSKSGYVLQEHESRQKRQVGSLTKIATAMVVLDWAEKRSGDLNQVATIPADAFVGSENNVGFQPGDTATLRDLLYAALVQSDNVAAYTLAAHVGQTLQGVVPASGNGSPVALFVSQMNALAINLKMGRTRFVNPHGHDDVKPVPYSTALDMARLTRYAMDKAGFRFYVSQKERQISFTRAGKPMAYMLRNTNELLGRNGVEGVKTGRTARAGDCLVLSAQRQSEIIQHSPTSATVMPRHLIIVLLGSQSRFVEGEQLLNTGWALYDQWAANGRPMKKTL
ncbi:MAG: D-alanyl-D-alanine carboxypeptidase [Chthoniobacterales bacterium]|nr:D-alanyl-D-alanine carboxypeptidase [Chthoniobacterales bacterium]